MNLHKEYHKIPESAKTGLSENTEIKCVISFNRDSVNWATSQPKKIGYQATIIPVERTDRGQGIVMESSSAFSGFNDCLLECDRQSKKRLEKAIEMLHERLDRYLQYFIKVEETI